MIGRHIRAGTALPALTVAIALETAALPAFAAPPTRGGQPTASPGPEEVEITGDELGPNRCKKWQGGKRYTITIPRESELEQLVQWMMSISCQKFIWGAKVRSGKVTILSPEQVTLPEAYAAFYAALETMGLTVEPAGDYFKIVESADPKSLALPMYGDGSNAPNNDRFVTQLVRVKGANAKEIAEVANKLKSKTGSVDMVGNLLIITDRGSVVKRLRTIVEELDTYGSGEKIFFYQLQYADAEEVASIIREIFGEGGGEAAAPKRTGKKDAGASSASFSRVIVDDRTGTLIIVASESDYVTIYRLIQQLDVRLPGGGGRIHVRRLKNADPKEVATTLSQLTSGAGAAGGGGDKTSGNKSAASGGVSAELFSGEVKITADEATRSLVIVASQADYKSLEAVIDELDAERRQVYIEMWLMETTVGRKLEAGAGGHFAFPIDTNQGQGVGLVASAPTQQVNSLLIDPTVLQGLAAGILGPQLAGSGQLLGLGQDIPSFGVIVQALQTLDDVNVVAEPHVYTADNKEAQLEVGQRVPTPGALSFGGGQGGVQGNSFTPLQSINREDVTLDIKITPHVNDERTIALDIELEDRDIVSVSQTLGVTTTKRRIKLEQVLTHDDQPVVLGGLIREREAENASQIPGLGSIPILGWLFKRKVKERKKVNLLIILVPHVVESPDDIRRIHERRTNERLEFIERESNFKRKDLETAVNYRKKAGLLSTVDAEARRLEQEELILRQAEEELKQERITGELGVSPRTEGGGEVESEEAVPKPAPAPKPPSESSPPGIKSP
jgi:general secretion pathway protein D